MKNLPENNFWNEIKDRLDHYAEEPADDSWDKIAGAINNTPQPRIIAWLERRASSTQVSLAGFAFLVALAAGDQAATTWGSFVADAGVERVEENTATVQQEHSARAANVHDQQSAARETSGKMNSVGDVNDAGRNVVHRSDQQKIAAHTDPGKVALSETSPIAPLDTTGIVDPVYTGKHGLSAEMGPAVDTVDQKDPDKKKKDVVVTTREKKEAEKKDAQLHIPMVYFQVGPSLAFHKITPSTSDDVTITDLEESGVFATDRAGFSVEAGFQYPVLPRLEVYGGLSYYQQNQNIRYTLARAASGGVSGNADDGYVFTPATGTHEVKYTMRNAGVSAGVFYRVKTHLLEHKLGVGVLYQQGFQSAAGEGSAYTNKGSKYWQYQLQYRMEAGLNDHMRLYFQPGYTHAFHVDEKLNGLFTIKPYRAGISVGIVYLFKK
ncbi:hypothetical protein [Dawidia soli]|uniref:Outer membrane protein beta-barrel domain-containing protein n=1 Tax=Dawidia soli TaxID=2782352 RepID=A0AAP2DFX0_9BACT|nr:hypothetical protein [Dawidia soli]MBT1690542.1 hypothetical protein [Dawidia soli]